MLHKDPIISGSHFTFRIHTGAVPGHPNLSPVTRSSSANHFLFSRWRNTAFSGLTAQGYSAETPYCLLIHCSNSFGCMLTPTLSILHRLQCTVYHSPLQFSMPAKQTNLDILVDKRSAPWYNPFTIVLNRTYKGLFLYIFEISTRPSPAAMNRWCVPFATNMN